MQHRTVGIVFLLIAVLLLTGCQAASATKEELFTFQNSYIGDNSSVGNLLQYLRNSEQLEHFELQTTEEPYGMELHYAAITGDQIEETAIFNATFIFALVQNAEWVTFHFDAQTYQLTRDDLQERYGKDLRSFSSEDAVKEAIEKLLENHREVEALLQD
ncbi:hypothetical protein Pryu01_01848 [Paraliobacillus ryukyuensis]|uniref:Uncharacterized protein DUF4825 n=1 Tax=Paraliobacillus ryukyuensis TaxID=200904 RepID=A0A366DSW8_9BACI|nr:DUF4825 domain-containing protein [Paraliobacillus ryukyuensis]RBO93186.1 uncharacterized protein DUF4825 [Paraliobacillus ryukyuensis]